MNEYVYSQITVAITVQCTQEKAKHCKQKIQRDRFIITRHHHTFQVMNNFSVAGYFERRKLKSNHLGHEI